MRQFDFRCITVDLALNEQLARLSAFEWMTFAHMQLRSDERYRLPYDALFLRNVIFPARPSVNVGDVAKTRDKLLAMGALIRKSSSRKEWLEIAESFRHEQGKEWSYGEPEKADTQPELHLGPVPVGQPRALPRTGVRREKKKTRQDESPASEPLKVVNNSPAPKDSETRAMDRREGESKDRFARDEDDLPGDDLWADLSRTLGLVEMTGNGALWERRIRTSRRAVILALQDWNAKTPSEKAAGGGNAAAYITATYEAEIRRAS